MNWTRNFNVVKLRHKKLRPPELKETRLLRMLEDHGHYLHLQIPWRIDQVVFLREELKEASRHHQVLLRRKSMIGTFNGRNSYVTIWAFGTNSSMWGVHGCWRYFAAPSAFKQHLLHKKGTFRHVPDHIFQNWNCDALVGLVCVKSVVQISFWWLGKYDQQKTHEQLTMKNLSFFAGSNVTKRKIRTGKMNSEIKF